MKQLKQLDNLHVSDVLNFSYFRCIDFMCDKEMRLDFFSWFLLLNNASLLALLNP